MSSSTSQAVSGPPYAPTMAMLGEIPSNAVDTPIAAVFIAIFLSCAITNIIIFRTNLSHGHKFLFSGLMVGFCMARVLTCVLRIVWANRLDDVSTGIAATLFNNLGVFLLYIINLLWSQRILRARKPSIGWHVVLKAIFIAAYTVIAIVVVLLITFTVLSFYTRDMSVLTAAHDIQLFAATFLIVFVTLPWILLTIAHLPGIDSAPQEHFGHGSLGLKTAVLLVLTTLMVLEQGYKTGVAWVPAQPIANAPWYYSRAAFYCFGFLLEVIWMLTALSMRVDMKFHVPNGSSKRKTYTEIAAKERVSIDSV